MATLFGYETKSPLGNSIWMAKNVISFTTPSTESLLSIILIFEPILKGKLKKSNTDAVILLSIDHEAKRAIPATAKKEAKIPLKDTFQIKPNDRSKKANQVKLKNLLA